MKLQTESEHPVATCRRGEEKNCHCTPARRSRRRQSRDSRPHARPPATSIHLHARRRQCKGVQDQEHGIDTAAGGTRRRSGEPRRAAATAFLGGGRCLIYRPGGRGFKYRPPWVSSSRPIEHVRPRLALREHDQNESIQTPFVNSKIAAIDQANLPKIMYNRPI